MSKNTNTKQEFLSHIGGYGTQIRMEVLCASIERG
jgi:hypothetical protein